MSGGAPVRLLHVAPWIRTTGGVETLLARHAQADAALGFDAAQLALFDPADGGAHGAYATHAFSWRSTPRGMQAAMARACAARAGSVIAWHNAWGLPWFAPADGSVRRIACLQDSVTHFGPLLPGLAGWVDGATCLSAAAARSIRAGLPELPPERVAVMPLPIVAPPGLSARRPARDEWVIGCAGRLVRAQKRWDRLVPFVEELRRLGVRHRLEIISDGPLRPWLERRLGRDPAIRFLGWQSRADYWQRMQDWDAAVSFTDHEGGPIVLLEAMAAGVIPLYPAIGGSLGDECAPRVDPRCHYPAGDPVAAARALAELRAAPPAELEAMRSRAQAVARTHGPEEYEQAFARLVRAVAAGPRLSRPPGGVRPGRLADWLPLGLLTRVWPAALER
jgi:glycosyltransferase involved in cell wall biosynthesis